MSLSKIQSESINLADNFAFTGTVTGTPGITMADQWRLTADNSMSSSDFNDITSNWERNDNSGFGQLGTGMTESSGIFTFPSTGIYLIKLVFNCVNIQNICLIKNKLEII